MLFRSDAMRFDVDGEQGVSALQNYVASQLGKDVSLVIYTIVDGAHRFAILKSIGFDYIPCVILNKSTSVTSKTHK